MATPLARSVDRADLADDQRRRDRTPDARVARVLAVVAHHEHGAARHAVARGGTTGSGGAGEAGLGPRLVLPGLPALRLLGAAGQHLDLAEDRRAVARAVRHARAGANARTQSADRIG